MSLESSPDFATALSTRLGMDAATVTWPVAFALEPGEWPAVFDPHHELLMICGATAADFRTPDLAWCVADDPSAAPLCTRQVAVTAVAEAAPWQALGFTLEAALPGYWEQGDSGQVWCRTVGQRSAAKTTPPLSKENPQRRRRVLRLPSGWICRPAEPADAVALTVLIGEAFAGCEVPTDPGAIRFALASGEVHGRVICDERGAVQAYAALESRPGGGAAELTDCATRAAHRGRGLMRTLVRRLLEDQRDVFGSPHLHAFAREDQPAMAAVLAGLGWRLCGRLRNHYKVDGRWISAEVWAGVSPPA